MPDRVFLRAALLAALSLSAFAEDPLPQVERLKTSPVLRHLLPNRLPAPPRTPPEETIARMHLPEGFRAEVVVAEPDLHQPVAFAFDERGRIWVAEAYSYPQRQPEGQGLDKLVIFEDADGDGKFETRKVFAEKLNLVSGFEVGHGGVWVGAAPELLFIADRNRDDAPDGPPEVLLDGFGYQDTHECLNSFMWGPDGWLYGNQGVFNFARIGKPGAPDAQRTELRAGIWRYHPVRREFEVFAEGGSNQWGLDYDERGQIFMTHCRSYWGRGGTTHVIQGGIFWNQANANYPAWVVADPPADYPGFKNYLLASARYDHGQGGAGEPGTDAIYGGHSHVGTMLYYGDNWPAEYRGRVFTHNLHGHQINQQVNRRLGSGFDTVHAGRDISFCADPKFVAIDLQYGPDGAVYMIDWYDQQHCHNPNTERWDRANGRIYRMQYDAAYKPAKVNLAAMADAELIALQSHRNEWFSRTARRLLHERAAAGTLETSSSVKLVEMASSNLDPLLRLRALWALHGLGRLDGALARRALRDGDEYIRAWAIQLASEQNAASLGLRGEFARLAQADPSPVVRLYLASSLPRLAGEEAWQLGELLAQHGEDAPDRNIPFLLWHGLAPLMEKNPARALALAERTLLPSLADWIYWRAAALGGDSLNRVVEVIGQAEAKEQKRLLAGLELALRDQAAASAPPGWGTLSARLYESQDAAVVRRAETVAAAFGDQSRFPQLRSKLANAAAPRAEREHAFAVLSRALDAASLPVFIQLLPENPFRARVIPLLGRFEAPSAAQALLGGLGDFAVSDRNTALNALASRASSARLLLEGAASGQVPRDYLNALHLRQITQLGDAALNERVAAIWGRVTTSAGEKQAAIARLEKIFNEAPLWAYDTGAGRAHFQKICAACHVLGQDGVRLGPELTGAGANGIRYYLENIIDPNAVVGAAFQMTTIETKEGDVLSGLLLRESADTVTLRTAASEERIAKPSIAKRAASENSLMPEGLLEALAPREQIELLKYLATH